jgi:glycosyltransferase involved in cell wall biosynthesis
MDGGQAPSPTVSVVIPAFNRDGTIRTAIESVLRQTFSDFELIVVDDGSTDRTVDVARSIDDPRVRVVAVGANRGISATRNRGIAEARAGWIAFQDSDDEWLPDKLALQMAALDAMGDAAVAAFCGLLTIGTLDGGSGRTSLSYTPERRIPCQSGDILPELMKTSFVSTQTLVARTPLLRELGGFDEDLASIVDWELALRLAARGPFAFVDEPLVLQRFSANSVTRDPAKRVRSQTRIVEKHRELFAREPAVLHRHYLMLSGGWRRLGEAEKARHYAALAREIRPLHPRSLVSSARALAGSLLGGERP